MSYRNVAPLMAIVMLALGSHAQGEMVIPSRAFGIVYNSRFDDDLVASSPDWKLNADDPPLSARKAIAIADQVVKIVQVPKDRDLRRFLMDACLVPYGNVHPQKWYWIVSYQWLPRVGGGSATQPFFHVVIMMDGTAVKPEVVKPEVKKRIFAR